MSKQTNRNSILGAALALAAGLALLGALAPSWLGAALVPQAAAAPARQIPIYTPTPLPDGRIIYKVQEGDTLLSISLLTGVSVDQLRELNNMTTDNLIAGQDLLLGLSGPPEVKFTPGPTPTPTSVLPTPSPRPGSGNLCILLFNDLNGDSIRQEEEPSIPDGAISVSNRLGTVSKTDKTAAGTEPTCFEKLAEGEYSISVAVPAGYNPTTENNYNLKIQAGDETHVDFGAQMNSEAQAAAPVPTGDGRSPMLGIVGGLFLMAGVGLALVAGRLLRR